MTKVELFEIIRRKHFIEGKSIRKIAREEQVHRRMVRQAIESAVPPARKRVKRKLTIFKTGHREMVDTWLEEDKKAPRKQRHTASDKGQNTQHSQQITAFFGFFGMRCHHF